MSWSIIQSAENSESSHWCQWSFSLLASHSVIQYLKSCEIIEFVSAGYPYYLLVTASKTQRAGVMQKHPIGMLGSVCSATGAVPAPLPLLPHQLQQDLLYWGTFASSKPQILMSVFEVTHTLYSVCSVEGEAELHPEVYEHQMQLQRWRIYSFLVFLKHYLLCISPDYQR